MTYKSLKLYHYPLTRSVRAKWMLHEVVGDNFEIERVAVIKGEMMTPEMLAKNPNHNLPMLNITWQDGSVQTMLESGAMVMWLADAFPDKQLAPLPGLSPARADYAQMIHFGANWTDSILWQIRLHRELLPEAHRHAPSVEMYSSKWTREIEPQLLERLSRHAFICGDGFTAADILMGYNVQWAQAYDICQPEAFKDYVRRLAKRPAFRAAYSDRDTFGD